MALQVCTSKPHTQLRLETPQNPRDQSSISLMFAESTLLGGKKKKFFQHAALEKSLPQQPAQLGAPAHICVPSCLCSVAAREAQPQPAASTGTPRAARGALLSGHGRKKPHCWKRERLLAPREFVSIWHKSMQSKVQALCSTPAQGFHPWNLPGTHKSAALSPAQDTQSHSLCLDSVSQMLLGLWQAQESQPLCEQGVCHPGEAVPSRPHTQPCSDSPCILDFGCPPMLSWPGCSHSRPY